MSKAAKWGIALGVLVVVGLILQATGYGKSDDTKPKPAVDSQPSVSQEAEERTAIMPDVVCMNLQAAQNRIQEAGAFFSRSEDASGGGRHQINDSNWLVIAQTPQPGATIQENEALLSVVKYGEPGSAVCN